MLSSSNIVAAYSHELFSSSALPPLQHSVPLLPNKRYSRPRFWIVQSCPSTTSFPPAAPGIIPSCTPLLSIQTHLDPHITLCTAHSSIQAPSCSLLTPRSRFSLLTPHSSLKTRHLLQTPDYTPHTLHSSLKTRYNT